jgi:hypothetical protein
MSKTTKAVQTTLDQQLKMSLKEVMSTSKETMDTIQQEKTIEDSSYQSAQALLALEHEVAKVRREYNDVQRESSDIKMQVLQNRLSGFSFQTELNLYKSQLEKADLIEATKVKLEYYEAALAHMTSVHKQLFS